MKKRRKKTRKPQKSQRSKHDAKIAEISNMIRKSLSQKVKNKNIVFFIGNGISGEDILSTRNIVSDFVKKSASARPRDFDKEREAAKRLSKTFESNGAPIDMTTFMSDYRKLEDTKQEFISYLIEACCRSNYNESHKLILLTCQRLSDINEARKRVSVFTTNYDNLLERAYLSMKEQQQQMKRYYYYYERLHIRHERPLPSSYYVMSTDFTIKPKYTLEVINDSRYLSIIPLHGSVRVCRCPSCTRTLDSEIASLGKMRCVYCGEELPRVVVPTSEGEADKQVLKHCEDIIAQSSMLLFVGYGFDDPHIIDRIKRGVLQNSERNELSIINVCHKAFPEDKVSLPSEVRIRNLETDVTRSLMEIYESLRTK